MSGALCGSFLYIILPLHEVNKAKGLLQIYIALKFLLSGFCIYVGWRLAKALFPLAACILCFDCVGHMTSGSLLAKQGISPTAAPLRWRRICRRV